MLKHDAEADVWKSYVVVRNGTAVAEADGLWGTVVEVWTEEDRLEVERWGEDAGPVTQHPFGDVS